MNISWSSAMSGTFSMTTARRLGTLDHVQERTPQVLALVPGITQPMTDTVADLAPASLGERLARGPTGQQLHARSRQQLRDLRHAAGVTQVPVQRQPAEMMPMRLDRLGILVSGQHHTVPSSLKPQAQTATATEKIRCQMGSPGPEAGRIGQELVLVLARLRMSGKADERAPDQLDAVMAALGCRCPVPHRPSSLNRIGCLNAPAA